VPEYAIVCTNSTTSNRDHFFKPVPRNLYPRINRLKEVLTGTSTRLQYCTIIEQKKTRKKYCGKNIFRINLEYINNLLGRDHPQGQGQIQQRPCKVVFNIFRPINLQETPYIIWVSSGLHSHPPPPPSRTPDQYLKEILQVIQRIQDPSLTLSKY
jgi:hypothetical protein